MGDADTKNVRTLLSAQQISPEERARRVAFGQEAVRREAVEIQSQQARTPEEIQIAELLEMAEVLLYTTEKACLEYLDSIPPVLHEAVSELKAAVSEPTTDRLSQAIKELEQMTNEVFTSPDGPFDPSGPGGSGAALG